MYIKNLIIPVLLISSIVMSCSEDDYSPVEDDVIISEELPIDSSILNLPDSPFNYANIVLPDYFLDNDVRNEDNTPNNNEVTDDGAVLGRVLFYDKKLSLNNTIACASCHLQDHGFSDPNQFSIGFNGELTSRNSMGLANAKFYQNGRFFWMSVVPL